MYAYLDQPVESLCNCGRLLVWATRQWSHARGGTTDPRLALLRGFAGVNALPALAHFNRAMRLLEDSAVGQAPPPPVAEPVIAEAEALLLKMWSDLARGDIDRLGGTLALLVEPPALARAMAAMISAADALRAAGFDLNGLDPVALKETK